MDAFGSIVGTSGYNAGLNTSGGSTCDTGMGVEPEHLSKIFDPFFTTREVGAGMGLGLSIVDRIVRGFSGYIEVESVPGKGACFSVYIPHYRDEAPAAAQEAAPV